MLNQVATTFDGFCVVRQWIPKGVPMRHQSPIPRDKCAPRPGSLISSVEKIVIGDTGYRGLTAQAAAGDRAQAYGHLIVDDTTIIECIPALTSGVGLVERAHFIGTRFGQPLKAEENAIFVNLCLGGRIVAAETFVLCVKLVACICQRFELSAEAIFGACDLDPARDDPVSTLEAAGQNLDRLRAQVTELAATRSRLQHELSVLSTPTRG